MTGRQPTSGFRRVDVFSASGGVGKTLLAIRLAQLQARHERAPVLLVDADIAGACVGDLLESWASPPWDSQSSLVHLICGRPEYLPEQLRAGKLPVYHVRDSCPVEIKDRAPERVTGPIAGEAVLICPSHAQSTNPRVEAPVRDALLGHESAGGWIGYVIEQLIRATARLMEGRLGGVVVDHGATMGALQSSTLRASADRWLAGGDTADRRAIIVTTPTASALAATRDLAGRLAVVSTDLSRDARQAADLLGRVVWIVNRIPPGDADWKESIKKRYPRNDEWLEQALPVRADDALAESHADGDLYRERSAAVDADLERVRREIFG